MTPSTILLGTLPRMLRAIIERAVLSHHDLRLAQEGEGADVEAAIARSGADVLIVEECLDRDEAFYRPLLLKYPSLTVFILTQGGRNATQIAFRRVRLVDTSSVTLIEAIRSAIGSGTAGDDD